MGCSGLLWGVLGCSGLLWAVLDYCGLHVFACGLRRMYAFSHVIEPTDRVCKHGFACGLYRMCAFSHVIEPTVWFVSTALHVDCAECVHFHM